MKTDLDIAQSATLKVIEDIAKTLDISKDALINYGPFMAKIDLSKIKKPKNKESKLILVTAMSPTPAGEGKTTTSIGLTDAIASLNKVL